VIIIIIVRTNSDEKKGALNVDGGILPKLQHLFNKTNGVLVAAVMSTIGEPDSGNAIC
jgi:hypothetical protein